MNEFQLIAWVGWFWVFGGIGLFWELVFFVPRPPHQGKGEILKILFTVVMHSWLQLSSEDKVMPND